MPRSTPGGRPCRIVQAAVLTVPVALAAGSAGAGGPQFVEETASRFPTPNPSEYTNQLTIGDIENDGDLDILWASGGGFSGSSGPTYWTRIFVNDGTGVFADETELRGGDINGNYRGIEMGDVDNDGDLDLVTVQDYARRVRLLINDGNGVFTYEFDRLPYLALSSSRAQFGDIDNDGDLDLFITDGGPVNRFGCGQHRLLINDGDGYFTDVTGIQFPTATYCQNMDCIFGDVDDDMDLDIIVAAHGSGNSDIFYNDGTGFYTTGNTPGEMPDFNTCYSVDFGDMNGDGSLDILGVNGATFGSAEKLAANDGDGTFTDVSSQISPNPSQDDNDSKFFDYDNDGDLDLIVGRLFGTSEKIYNNDGSGNFTLTSGLITSNGDATLDVMVADADNDGDYDVITAQGESGNFQNRIYINNGPADTHAPRIHAVEQVVVEEGETPGEYIVRARITDDMSSDRNFFDKGVSLDYSVDGGDIVSVPMKHSGGQVYRGAIPGTVGGLVEYSVSATDWNDNTATSDTLSFAAPDASVLGDLDRDGDVDVADLLDLLGQWGDCPGCSGDFDGDDAVGVNDLLTLLGNWS